MLTRIQVARRLGKSIATVRRMEGERLHPRRDARGVNRFDPDEVERVAYEAHGSVQVTRRPRPRDPLETRSEREWDVEEELRATKHRLWEAERKATRAERKLDDAERTEDSGMAKSAAMSAEVERLRKANAELRQCAGGLAALLLESRNEELRELGETVIEFLAER